MGRGRGRAVLAAALSFVLVTFAAAIGLSASSPWPHSGLGLMAIASLAVFWALAQQIGALMIGGYVAGRMRSRWCEAGDEARFRDGLHGALVWGVSVLLSALLLFCTAGLIAKPSAGIAGNVAASAASTGSNPLDAVVYPLLRPAAQTPASSLPSTGTAGATNDTRAEVLRILASAAASGSLGNENRTYLFNLSRSAPECHRRKRKDGSTMQSTMLARQPTKPGAQLS